MFPRNGGAQAYLAYTYGPLMSYLFTWTAILLLSPGEFSISSCSHVAMLFFLLNAE